MRNWLEGKYVVLSGASGGIGRELTKRLIRRYGAKIIGVGRSEEKMRSLKKELPEPADFSYFLFDVSEKTAWEDFAKELQAKRISPVLLINNAGAFPPMQRTEHISSTEIAETLQTNFLSAVYAVEAISPLLLNESANESAIVNICSSAALCPVVGSAAYTASKNAMRGYTETLQLEERSKKYIGIIYPGTTATDLFRRDQRVQNSAIGKIAMPAQKMAKKIACKIYRKKKRAVLGWDAKLMNFLAKIAPVKGPALIAKIMKISKSVAFENVFEYKQSGEKK